MTNEEIYERQRAYRAHQAAVPAALQAARVACDRFQVTGLPIVATTVTLDLSHLQTLVAEVDRLTALVKQQNKDAMDAQREFSRDARDIAAEVRWQTLQETRDGGY